MGHVSEVWKSTILVREGRIIEAGAIEKVPVEKLPGKWQISSADSDKRGGQQGGAESLVQAAAGRTTKGEGMERG